MANGAFLGGFAEGIGAGREHTRAVRGLDQKDRVLGQQDRSLDQADERIAQGDRGLDLRARGLDIRERQVKAAESRALRVETDTKIGNMMETIGELVEGSLAAGREPEQITPMIAPLLAAVTSVAPAAGRDPKLLEAQVQAMLTMPTGAEIAAAEGSAEASRITSQAGALEEAGIDTGAARATAGIKAAPNTTLRTFEMPDGRALSVPADDRASIDRAVAAGGVETPRSRQSDQISVTGDDQKGVDETRTQIRELSSSMEELDATMEQFEANPEAGGITGTIIEKAGGVLQQIPGGSAVLDMAGIKPEEVKAVRSQMRSTVSRMLSTITAEEGGRYTDTERRIAQEALGVLDETASDQQIRSAMQQAVNIQRRSLVRQVDRLRGQAEISVDDLRTPDGINRMDEILRKNGMTSQASEAAILDLLNRLGIGLGDINDG